MRHSAVEAPLLVVPSLRGADGVDGTTVSYLLAENLKLQKEEEEKKRRRKREEAEYEAHMQELDRQVQANVPLTPAEPRAWRKWAGHVTMPVRRRKKSKKKKLARGRFSRGRSRRRCQWHAPGWFSGSSAGLSFQASWLVWRRRTVMLWPRSSTAAVVCAMLVFLGCDAPRAVFHLVVASPKMFGIMAGMTQKDSCLEEYRKIGFYWEMMSPRVRIQRSAWYVHGMRQSTEWMNFTFFYVFVVRLWSTGIRTLLEITSGIASVFNTP